ncbi:hypothetical protein [Candidatus Protochlamydia sp. R18]|uniref:hypothetical protein n=1 Tax=Candidatus Protochlamydia sp. R18 TaxID=1353977 RepID=UPI0005A8899B|nr:hypothetical protein [Candidatus Protochlamydia sp. R18]
MSAVQAFPFHLFSYISPFYYQNYAVNSNQQTFVFHRKFVPIVQKFLEFGTYNDIHLTGIGLSHSVSLQTDLNNVLQFYALGHLPQSILEDLKTRQKEQIRQLEEISQHYALNLLSSILSASQIDPNLESENSLAFFDQLELCALRNNAEKFIKLLSEKSLDLQHESLLDQIYQMMKFFDKDAFVKVVTAFKKELFICDYQRALSIYLEANPDQLDELIYAVREPEFKIELISLIDDLVVRLMFFEQFPLKLSSTIVQQKLIKPLFEEETYEKIHPYAHQYQSSILESFSARVSPSPKLFLKKHLESIFQDFASQPTPFHLDHCIERVIQAFQKELKKENTQEFTVFAVQQVTQLSMEFFIDLYSKTFLPITIRQRRLFHPVFMQDLEKIKDFILPIKSILEKVFENDLELKLPEAQKFLLDEQYIEKKVISIACRLFQKQFSLKEEFILQYISKKLQPFFFKPFDLTFLQPDFFLDDLKKRLKRTDLNPSLSKSDKVFLICTYIRKRKEINEYRKCSVSFLELEFEISQLMPTLKLSKIFKLKRLYRKQNSPRSFVEKIFKKHQNKILNAIDENHLIDELVRLSFDHFSFNLDVLNESFFSDIERILNIKFRKKWTQELAFHAMMLARTYILNFYRLKIVNYLSKYCLLSEQEQHCLYPGFFSDYEFMEYIQSQVYLLQKKILKSAQISNLLKNYENQFLNTSTMSWLIEASDKNFQQKFCKEHFFLEQMSNYFSKSFASDLTWIRLNSRRVLAEDLPTNKEFLRARSLQIPLTNNLNKQPSTHSSRKFTTLTDSSTFLISLEEKMIENSSENVLAGEDLLFILRMWIRKTVEDKNANLDKPINPYNTSKEAVDMQMIEEIQEDLEKIFKPMLSKYYSRLPNKYRYVYGGSLLKREIIIQANHAKKRKELLGLLKRNEFPLLNNTQSSY